MTDYDEETREMICTTCHLLYTGWWPGNQPEGQPARKPCPECGEKIVHAADTISSAYYERNRVNEYGADFFKDHYWWLPEHVHPSLREAFRGHVWHEGRR